MRGAVPRIAVGLSLAVTLHGPAFAEAPTSPAERLDRFRALTSHLDPAGGGALADVYALLDSEMIESLAAGGVFASPAFLRERLEAFADAWGGLSVALLPLGRTVLAVFSFAELPAGSTVRVYGPRPGGAELRATIARGGWPVARPIPASAGGAQILVTWEGVPAADGTRSLLFEVIREETGTARATWSSSALFPEGLSARWYRVRGQEVTVRHAAHYPGWTSGCEGQTEYEDVYRLSGRAFARVSRRPFDAWHQEVHAAAERLFAALARGDRAALGALVPDAALRARLPAELRREPACERAPGADGEVAMAAVSGARDPWTVTFRRTAGRWRLAAATPMAP